MVSNRGFDRRWLALTVTTIGSFMTLLDSSIINVALPGIIKDFNSTVSRGQLVVTIYLLALAVVIPVSGFLGERVGMKRLYMGLLFAFAITSALCAVAGSMTSLIIFRALQGLGGGMLQPVGMAIIFTMITPLERGRFMVLLGLPILLAPILGPTVGGYLTQYASWRAIFLINVPIGILNLILARYLLTETEVRHDLKLDSKGFLLALMSFPPILFALSEASETGWGSPLVLGLLGVGVISLVSFVLVELKQSQPLLQLRLFTNPMFAIAMVLTFVVQFCFFGSSFLLPLFLQSAHGLGPAETGLVLFPSGVLDFLAIYASGRLYNQFGPRPFAIAGLAVLTVSALGLSRMTATTGVLIIAAVSSLRGFGIGLAMMPVMTMAYNTVAKPAIGRATALQNVLQRVFGSASAAMLTAIVVVSLGMLGAPAGPTITSGGTPVQFLAGAFSIAFTTMAVVAAAGTILSLCLHDAV
ncbi:MAG TPA: MDR family MFS transporter, partial [Dehalococcoidia bacterium]|nr:MDR family MFS transporter [Dehalococcoidia bacterium]